MIPKRIDRKTGTRDKYPQLAEYIAAAKETGEKLDKFWIEGCAAGTELQDLDLALAEIEVIRDFKPKISERTYHLVVSFRPGEREKLSDEDLKDIEREFAKALGYGDHQRVAGTHVNTDNFHMHVAYNKVHPVTHRVHTPRRDFFILEKTARAMEQKYGLFVDRGASESVEPGNAKVQSIEAQTWQQSFESHLKEHKSEILVAIAKATTWHEVHANLVDFDAGLKKRANGLVFHQLGGRHAMKASSLDRSCSLNAMEGRFGPYEPAPIPECAPTPKHPYTAKPKFHHPGQDRLWQAFLDTRKRPSFLARNFLNIRSWKDFLIADAMKDPLAMAIIITYKEFFRALEGAPAPTHVPRAILPALAHWFRALPWEAAKRRPASEEVVSGLGLQIPADARVIFPLRDSKKRTWAIRAVAPDGQACEMGDIRKGAALHHIIDPYHVLEGGKSWHGPIIITTDSNAAATISEAARVPIIIVARENDLGTFAQEMRQRHPESDALVVSPEKQNETRQAAKLDGETVLSPEAVIINIRARPELKQRCTEFNSSQMGLLVSTGSISSD